MQKIIEVGDGSQAVILVNNLLHPAVSVMPVDDQYESNSNSNISNVFVSDDPLFDGLNDYQVAFLDTLHASQDEVAAHLRRHSKVRIVSQTENAALGEWVLSVVGDEGMWIDCLSSQLEAIDQANKLGLQIVI